MMPAPTPQYTIAKPGGASAGDAGGGGGGGILPVPTTATNTNDKPAQKAPPQRLKVLVRRLPPGLTQAEFESILGDEWKLGNGKVSWFLYRPGKVSKDISKPSKPARAYFQLSQAAHLDPLADRIRDSSFLDARNTANDASLLAPPALEFAPYARVPLSRKRNDARKGLVDQDPEFIAFLESLTDPISKPPPVDSVESQSRDPEEAEKLTPLIQYLKNKKAAKEAAKDKEKSAKKEAKHSRQASKAESAANATASGKATAQNTKPAADTSDKKSSKAAKAEKSTKATAKQSKKELQQKSEQQPKPKTEAASEGAANPVKEPAPKRTEKASSASTAAKIIQRDLGIKGRGSARTRAGRQPAESDAPANGEKQTKPAAEPLGQLSTTTPADATPPTSPKQTSTSSKPPANPSILKREDKQNQPSKPAPKQSSADQTAAQSSSSPSQAAARAPKSKAPAKPQSITPTATQAFLKHANASQGITEPLLTTAMSAFGDVNHVEIDKRKGFAYVDFAAHEALKAAIAASPVKVAQGSVQVLERKDRPAAGGSSRAGKTAASGTASASANTGVAADSSPASTTATATTAQTTARAGGGRGSRGRGRGGGSARDSVPAAPVTAAAAAGPPPTGTEAKGPSSAAMVPPPSVAEPPADPVQQAVPAEAGSAIVAESPILNVASGTPASNVTASETAPASAPAASETTASASPPPAAIPVSEAPANEGEGEGAGGGVGADD